MRCWWLAVSGEIWEDLWECWEGGWDEKSVVLGVGEGEGADGVVEGQLEMLYVAGWWFDDCSESFVPKCAS